MRVLNENRASFTYTVSVNSIGTGIWVSVVSVNVSTVITRMLSVIGLICCRLNWLNRCVQNGAIVVMVRTHTVSTDLVIA